MDMADVFQVISTHRALVKRPEYLPGFSNQVSGMRLSKRVKSVFLTFCVYFSFSGATFAHLVMIGQFWALLMIHDTQNVRVITEFLSQPNRESVMNTRRAVVIETGANRFYKWSF